MTARIIGIDLSLLHTGIAVSTIDGNIIFSGGFSVNSPENLGVENREMQQVTRMAQWTEQAKACLLHAFYYARREDHEAPVYLVYESRPFLMAKHRKGIQSAPAVMSYAESLCMLRSVLAQVVTTPCAKPEPLMGAISPKWWQGNLVNNVMVSQNLVEEARSHHLKGVPKDQVKQKAYVMAALYTLTDCWPKSDHEADAQALAITVASALRDSPEQWGSIIDAKHNW